MLDLECFSFLCSALESELSPVLVMATNRGMTKIRGTEITAPFGIPADLRDRLLIIPTSPYNEEEIDAILTLRANAEDIPIGAEARKLLVCIAAETSLRYAMQLLTQSALLAARAKQKEVRKEDVQKAYELFVDVKRSSQFLGEYMNQMMQDEDVTME